MRLLEKLTPLALLLLRVSLGIVFIYHGYPKLFTSAPQAAHFFVRAGFPSYFAYIAGAIEFFGGILLIVGLFTRFASLLITCEMAVALWRVHQLQGGWLAVDNYEYPLVLACACFALVALGAGIISLDHAIFRGGGKGKPAARKPKA
ncbi:MAG: DoxX family protein [Candidatus Acidiferrales bacterium]